MNKTVPGPTNWPDQKPDTRLTVKKSGIRAIDKGTNYDVPGKLRKLAREIEKGVHDEVRGALVGITSQKDGKMHANYIAVGCCSIYELNTLADFLVKRTSIQ
jgi:hypothetical protein